MRGGHAFFEIFVTDIAKISLSNIRRDRLKNVDKIYN